MKTEQMMEIIFGVLSKWVRENYDPYKCSWTAERSAGNCDDCFDDGCESQRSWDAYEIGKMLKIDLEEPQKSNENE